MNIQTIGLILAILTLPGQANAKQERSEAAKNAFKAEHPCPANGATHGSCPGHVIDHINPLACGGADDPSNMQWQTVEAGKAKDKWERKGCTAGQRDPGPTKTTDCGSKTICGQMDNCAEAKHYLNDCGMPKLDRDGDGIPCESLCRN